MKDPRAARFCDWWDRMYDRIDHRFMDWPDAWRHWVADMDIPQPERSELYMDTSDEYDERRWFRMEQGEAFLRMYRRRPSGDWESVFERWADSKDFQPLDRMSIKRMVSEQFLADGTCTFADPLDYLNHDAA